MSRIVDQFIELLREKAKAEVVVDDIGELYEMMTFDIIGDLAFGESFRALETDQPHPWIAVTLGALTKGALVDTMKRFPLLASVVKVAIASKIEKLIRDTRRNEDMAIELVEQ